MKKKMNCIIDTDPGVDDTAAIALSLYDDVMDIKLVTTVSGNLDINTVTRNTLHVLEKFGRSDIPVAKGASKPLKRKPKDAKFIHGDTGLGFYNPPEKTVKQPIEKDAVEAMYETIVQFKYDISIILLGPLTNMAQLLLKHPDVAGMINHIYAEGCSPYGWHNKGKWGTYVSFNASSDPEAVDIVVKSGIPISYIFSRMGRELVNFTEKDVIKLREINDTGRFLSEMYSGYWEHGYDDRRIALNDTCACLLFRFPKLFKTRKVKFEVDIKENPGMTTMEFDKNGNVDLAIKVNRKKLHKLYFAAVKKLDRFKFYDD